MDKKPTDSEIVKALECCAINGNCKGCYFNTHEADDMCARVLMQNALGLIKHLQEKSEDFKFLYENLKEEHLETIKAIKHAKIEAYKEFAERLKEDATYYSNSDGTEWFSVDIVDIDNFLKELVVKINNAIVESNSGR